MPPALPFAVIVSYICICSKLSLDIIIRVTALMVTMTISVASSATIDGRVIERPTEVPSPCPEDPLIIEVIHSFVRLSVTLNFVSKISTAM